MNLTVQNIAAMIVVYHIPDKYAIMVYTVPKTKICFIDDL